MRAIACSKSVPLDALCLAPHAGGQQCANLIPSEGRGGAESTTCRLRNTSLRSATTFVRQCIRQVHVSQMALNRSSERWVYFDSALALCSWCKMWADPTYVRSWRDLRRRDLLFWFFLLSYVPGILLIIVVVNVLDHDAPEHIGIYFSAAWLAGFVGTSLYRQNFRCPRCHNFFFRRFRFVESYTRNCLNCNLACWAPGP